MSLKPEHSSKTAVTTDEFDDQVRAADERAMAAGESLPTTPDGKITSSPPSAPIPIPSHRNAGYASLDSPTLPVLPSPVLPSLPDSIHDNQMPSSLSDRPSKRPRIDYSREDAGIDIRPPRLTTVGVDQLAKLREDRTKLLETNMELAKDHAKMKTLAAEKKKLAAENDILELENKRLEHANEVAQEENIDLQVRLREVTEELERLQTAFYRLNNMVVSGKLVNAEDGEEEAVKK
ncbi:uncharacterized protein HMPREF1541_07367 [Cyphellophora europaea CBS 101466]|uniref:Uncharacterized protein n=1 Tax=Cyphellophora europaea (strain CBS 101466) TaxID=1220924 RepID=W2RPT7_CYPE1|nr:uncharacterized protein HMPREF1541_07367 [Cyphellophora europaea CBS 101466]ETN37744.1 hypothetical protein HMPREF1541_07367 [Cyphellophora europaea CBS 101466]